MPITPDDKDWTWVLERTCPECGFNAGDVDPREVGALVRENAAVWAEILARPAPIDQRPADDRWSALEYACHVRDVCRLFEQRLTLMLTRDAPTFANWDQDETAVVEGYGEQDPPVVAREVAAAAASFAGAYAAVPADAWERTGHRSDGSQFTVLTLGQYGLHDLAHHLWDVGVVIS